MERRPVTAEVAGSSENVAALATQLTSFDLAEIDEIMRNGAAVVARYPAPMLRLVDR